MGGGEVTLIYKPYRYVPPQREGFLPRGDTTDFDRDDRMGLKIKTKKVSMAFNKTHKKSLDQKLTPKKSHAEFLSLKKSPEFAG